MRVLGDIAQEKRHAEKENQDANADDSISAGEEFADDA